MPAVDTTPVDLLKRLIATQPDCAHDSLLTPPPHSLQTHQHHEKQQPQHGCDAGGGSGCAKAHHSDTQTAAAAAAADSLPPPRQVAVEAADTLGYADFVARYMAPNLPVLIKGACKGWRALAEWGGTTGAADTAAATGGAGTIINMTLLQELAGHCRVSVTDTARHHQGSGPCTDMTFSDYCAWWDKHHQHHQADTQPHQQADKQQHGAQEHNKQQPLLYLKDWHFVGEFPGYQAYTTPVFFKDDWLNEYYDHKHQEQQQQQQEQQQKQQQQQQPAAAGNSAAETTTATADNSHAAIPTCHTDTASASSSSVVTCDYRFVYMGPAGSWTPVHSDVLRSYSWSANVVGRKRWWLLPPQKTHLFLDRYGQLPSDFLAEHVAGGDCETSAPSADAADAAVAALRAEGRRHLLELVQDAGDVLFVPSGWHHCVLNEVDTLSINHNWLNGHNIHASWALLEHEHKLATEQLEDCRDTASPQEVEELVQKMLAANSGFDFAGFAAFVLCIVRRRLRTVQSLLEQPVLLQEQQQPHLQPPPLPQLQMLTAPLSELWGSVGGEAEVRLQLAFDLTRAANVLQLLLDAMQRAAERNAAWFVKAGGSRASVNGVATATAAGAVQLPAWVHEVAEAVGAAQAAVQQLMGSLDRRREQR